MKEGSLINFSIAIVTSLKNETQDYKKIVEDFFPGSIDEEFKTLKHLNAYESTRYITSNHLMTGTIFKLTENGDSEYWVCLTPACDLVPSQSVSKWGNRIGNNHLPFQAVKLIPSNEGDKAIIKDINSNERLFIHINENIETFKFRAGKNSSPIWETFYAMNHGRFNSKNTFNIQRLRLIKGGIHQRGRGRYQRTRDSKDREELRLSDSIEVQAITELRYEYALNLLQRFGANQTRVGLDFVNKLWN